MLKKSLLGLCLLVVLGSLPAWGAGEWMWIAYGDTRTQDKEHRQVLAAIKKYSPGYAFIINVGDVVENGANRQQWDRWEKACAEELGGTGQASEPPKYMAVPGNHDDADGGGAVHWKHYLPGQARLGHDGKFLTFEYRDARFVLLDSEHLDSREQQVWLDQTLATSSSRWLFAVWHKPIFNFGAKSYEDELHKKWGVPLYTHGADIIFNGHAHEYVRTLKLGLDGEAHPPLDEARGTATVIAGNGGAPLHGVNVRQDGNEYMVAYAYDQAQKRFYGYTEITVDGDHLRLRHIRTDGTVMDTAEYRANAKPKPAALSAVGRN